MLDEELRIATDVPTDHDDIDRGRRDLRKMLGIGHSHLSQYLRPSDGETQNCEFGCLPRRSFAGLHGKRFDEPEVVLASKDLIGKALETSDLRGIVSIIFKA